MGRGDTMAISTEVCIKCRRLFNYPGFGTKYCPDCMKEDEKLRQKVKDFLYENGAANMYEISQATGVSEHMIRQYLRDGMLEIPENSPIFIKCEKCGCDIRYGRWCPECAAQMSAELKGCYIGVGEKPKSTGGKMRFLNKEK